MSKSSVSPAAPRQHMVEFLVLASHALQTPLSGIRWGLSRLHKSEKDSWTQEQKKLLAHIDADAHTLSRLLQSLILVTRAGDSQYVAQPQSVDLSVLLDALVAKAKAEGSTLIVAKSDVANVLVDMQLLEGILQNLLGVFLEAQADNQSIQVSLSSESGMTSIHFDAPLEFPLIDSDSVAGSHVQTGQIVGGTAGLMLSMAQALAQVMHGTVEMEPMDDGMYRIDVQLPTA